LEPRLVPAVTYHGGPVIANVQVETVFLGAAWTDPRQLQTTAQNLDTYFTYLTNSPYMDVLNQYGVGRGSFIGTDTAGWVGQVPTLSDGDIQYVLNTEMQRGSLPLPAASTVYFVFTPPHTVVTRSDGSNSEQSFLGYHDSYVGPNGQQVIYAMVDFPDYPNAQQPGLTQFQQLTAVSSHELAEAATDPFLTAWYDSSGEEIADLAEGQFGTLHGYVVQKLWSNAAGGPVLPTESQPSGWTYTAGFLKTTVAGIGEVFGLDANGLLWIYNDTTGWTNTGTYGRSLSVGIDSNRNDELWLIADDYSVWRYDQGSWFNTGGYLAQIVAGQGEVFGLDGGNEVWIYNDYSGWFNTQGHAAQIAVGVDLYGADELWVRTSANAIWRFDQGRWFNTNGHLTTIEAGQGEVFGLDGANAVWIYNDYSGWFNTQAHALGFSVGIDAQGQDELWVQDGSDGIWRYDQGSWWYTGGHLSTIVAGIGEVFGLDSSNGVWVFNDAAGWTNTQAHATQISVGLTSSFSDELWVHDGQDGIWRYN
jgi:uncharacterized protein YneR